MAPTDSIELEHEPKETKLEEASTEQPVPQLNGKCQINEEEMVTSFIEGSPTADRSLPRVDEEKAEGSEKAAGDSQKAAGDSQKAAEGSPKAADRISGADPGEGTSGQCKSVVINVPEEQPKSERAVNGNQEKLVTRAVTESPVQVVDESTPEGKQETATKNTKRYELQRWDNKRSCFFVFFLLLFFIWVIVYYLYASGWLYRKINNIR